MSATRCYLDFNATAPLRPVARDACVAALDVVGNASSIHAEGRGARRLIEQARARVGRLVDAAAAQVVFTSGGTEAANLLVSPDLGRSRTDRPARLLVSAIEHAAVLRGHRFAPELVTVIPVDRQGVVDLDRLEQALKADGGSPAMLALQAANNETGVIQPVATAADLVHGAGGVVVCDAVQAVGRLPWSLAESHADAIVLSAHKIGGPQGVGAAILVDGVASGAGLIRGGGQERGLRSGTENVAGIAGFGAAAVDVHAGSEAARLIGLQARLEAGLRSTCETVVIFGAEAPRLPNTTCFAVSGLSAETLLMAFDLAGIALSSGSACSSGKVARSHVLEAMGIPPDCSAGALRVSFGWSSREADADRFLDAFATIMLRLQRRPEPVAA